MKGPKAKRSLSQNFLIDAGVARRIAFAANVGPGDLVLEVGAGKGELTGPLVETDAHVLAVEIDARMIDELKMRFANSPEPTIIQADILKLDFEKTLDGRKAVLAANLPYNLSSPFLFRLFENRHMLHRALLTLQHEFARRLIAKVGTKEYGILTVFCALVAKPQILFSLSPQVFRPMPRVKSAVLMLDFNYIPPSFPKNEFMFKRVVRAAFGQRRKKIHNSLGQVLGSQTIEILTSAGIDPSRRAETLNLIEWVSLADAALKYAE